MRKRLAVFMLAVTAVTAAGLTGCVEQTKVSGMAPDMSKKENVALDFVQLHNDSIEAFGDEDENPYKYITSVDISGDNDTKTVNIKATCFPDTGLPEAEQFATAIIRRVNDAACTQSTEFELSNQESFGTFWTKYALNIQIIPDGKEEDVSSYIINESIPAGEEIPFDTDYETYEEGYIEILESLENEPAVLNFSGSGDSEDDASEESTDEQGENAEDSEASDSLNDDAEEAATAESGSTEAE